MDLMKKYFILLPQNLNLTVGLKSLKKYFIKVKNMILLCSLILEILDGNKFQIHY